MNREEIKNKLFDIILKNSSPTIEIKRTIDYQQTMAIVEELIKHEQDTLKEFVEWYKSKVIKDRIQVSKKQEEYCNEIDEPIKAILWEHESKVLQRISYCLNDDLEKFLEERKK